jgi:ubiquitin carboxyl-terminal hydrolase 4/11/15
VVSASAYLLFYRRRSDKPLGGPRFQDIANSFDNAQDTSEDELAGSGEDRSLAANSFRGSSSALTGVGAARHQPNRGLGRTVNPHDIEGLPDYQAHEEHDEDAAPLLLRDAEMNDGLPLHSIEDEGIDVGMNYNNIALSTAALQSSRAIGSSWNFAGIEGINGLNRERNFISGTGSEVDAADRSTDGFDPDGSDIVQNNSSASSGSVRGRLRDFETAVAEGDDGPFEDPSPVPDTDGDNQLDALALHRDLLHARRDAPAHPDFTVTAADPADEVEEPATEIHVEDGEGLKMD